MNTVTFIPITGLPFIKPGDDLARLTLNCLELQGVTLQPGDILAFAQKIVSKSEGRLVNMLEVEPGERAIFYGDRVDKDPRHVEVILQESRKVLYARPGIFVVETHHGYVCANAGVDISNTLPAGNNPGEKEAVWLCLLPLDPDASAQALQQRFVELTGVKIGILINDTHGRPFRMGGVGVALGSAGIPMLLNRNGESDLFGYQLQATLTAAGDELAAATSLLMGQASEGVPAVLVRGLKLAKSASKQPDEGSRPLIRPPDKDVFRYPTGGEDLP